MLFFAGSQHAAVRLAAALLWLRKHGTPFWQEYIASLPQVSKCARLPVALRHLRIACLEG